MLPMLRRAPTACSWCRYRKVRCDGSTLGCPCTRCRQDGRENCVLRDRPKQLKRAWGQPRLSGPSQSVDADADADADQQDGAERAQKRRFFGLPHSEYPFIDSQVLSRLPPEDVAFLSAKGATSLPDRRALHEFVHQYFKRIHPSVPMIDEAEFWRIYDGVGSVGSFSLFVFQAILFASCPFVSLETLRRSGFNDKRDTRKQLYNRAKLLFDLNVETRPSAKAQGAVLLTHHTSAEDPRAGSLWLARAVENAMMICAQPSLFHVENINPSHKRRLWWSILLRDRSLCIGLRRRPQVPVEYCDWMTEEDFADELLHSRVYDEGQKRRLLGALLEQCELAVLLSDLVSLVFAPRVRFPAGFLSEEQFDGLMGMIARIRSALLEWEKKTPGLSPHAPGTIVIDLEDDPVAMLSNLTAMYFYAARVDLAQYAAFTIEENLPFAKAKYTQRMHEISQDLNHSIEGLTSALEYFSNQGHLESLPLSVLGYVGMPLILAAINLKLSTTHPEMTARKARLDTLSAIIRHSETLYDVTDFVAIGINHVLQLAYLTTRTLFLRTLPAESAQRLPASSPSALHADSPTATATSSNLPRTKPVRATNWIDAFILWPRAYLLISTSVDLGLAAGRLPSDIALPELVRHIPAMGAEFRLPWTVGGDGDAGCGGRRLVVGGGRERAIMGVEEREADEYEGVVVGEGSEKEEERPRVNLDFFDLGDVSRTDDASASGDDDLVTAEDHDTGGTCWMGAEGSQEDQVGEGTDFDTELFNMLSSELLRADGVEI